MRLRSIGFTNLHEALDAARARPSAMTEEQVRHAHRLNVLLDFVHVAEYCWTIGAIEGTCRHLIADRLNITSARWGLSGAEAVLQLRALITNSDFEDYWRFHAAREHQRVYASPDQQNYSLTA